MLLKKGANQSVDIYGIGTILYELLIGLPPYYDEDVKTMFANITFAKLKIPKYVSSKARALLKVLLIFGMINRDYWRRIRRKELRCKESRSIHFS